MVLFYRIFIFYGVCVIYRTCLSFSFFLDNEVFVFGWDESFY